MKPSAIVLFAVQTSAAYLVATLVSFAFFGYSLPPFDLSHMEGGRMFALTALAWVVLVLQAPRFI